MKTTLRKLRKYAKFGVLCPSYPSDTICIVKNNGEITTKTGGIIDLPEKDSVQWLIWLMENEFISTSEIDISNLSNDGKEEIFRFLKKHNEKIECKIRKKLHNHQIKQSIQNDKNREIQNQIKRLRCHYENLGFIHCISSAVEDNLCYLFGHKISWIGEVAETLKILKTLPMDAGKEKVWNALRGENDEKPSVSLEK